MVAVIALIPVDINGSQVKPLGFSSGLSLPVGGEGGIARVNFFTLIVVFVAAPWHPETQLVIRTIIVCRVICVSASNLRLLKRHLRGQIVKQNSIGNTHSFRADDLGTRWVLRLLNRTLDCSKSVLDTLCW